MILGKDNIEFFLDKGMEEIVLSLSSNGVILGTKEETIWYKHRKVEVRNVTGAGDSFLGAYLHQRRQGISPKDAIPYAISAAIFTIEQDNEKVREIKDEDIQKSIPSLEIKEKKI